MVTFEMRNSDPMTVFYSTEVLFILKYSRTVGLRMLPSGAVVACEFPVSPSHSTSTCSVVSFLGSQLVELTVLV